MVFPLGLLAISIEFFGKGSVRPATVSEAFGQAGHSGLVKNRDVFDERTGTYSPRIPE